MSAGCRDDLVADEGNGHFTRAQIFSAE